MLGRSSELARFDALLDRAAAGARGTASGEESRDGARSRLVDITGEAGIGKSRLLGEVCARAHRRGMTVLRGRATEYERRVPFQVFTDALAHLGPHAPEGLRETDAAALLLGRSGAVDRFGLHRSTADLLARLAAPSGLLLALDDLHWADPASLELLDHLVRHPPHAPVVVAVTRRDRQGPESLAAGLTRGVDTGTVVRLGLRPLSAGDCAELAGPGLPPAETAALHAASEGNPFYFLTLLQARRDGTTPESSPPPGLGTLLLDELTVLAPARRGIVEAVAVLGEHATPAMVSRVTGRPGTAFADDVHALTRRDLLRTTSQGLLTLRHPVVRTLVHESTPFLRRAEIHRLAAQELARVGASAAERAHHVERSLTAWDPEAVAVLDEAAAQTARTAPASCAHWLDVALRHLPHTPHHALRRRELTLRRARALAACGGLRESRDLLQELIATPRRSPEGPTAGEDQSLRVRAVVLCAVVERHLGRSTEAVAVLRRELARDPAPAHVVRLGLELGSAAPLDSETSYARVRTEVEAALAAARSTGDEVGEAGVLAVAALGEAYEGNMTAAHRLARQAAALVDSLPDNDLTALCEPLARLGWAEAFLEHYPDAERHAERGLDIARRSGQLYVVPHLLLCLSHVRVQTCRIPSALELADRAEDIARGIGSDQLLAFVLASRAAALVAGCPPGDPRPLAVAEEAVAAAGGGVDWWASTAWCIFGWAALMAGDPVRARDAMLQAGGPELQRIQPSMRPLYLEILVTAALLTGMPEEARGWAERARKEAEQLGLPMQRASALRSAAHLPLAQGDTAAAADLCAEAAAESARCGAVFWEAQSLLLGAPLEAAAGRDRAATHAWLRGRRLAEAGGSGMLVGLADATRPPGGGPQAPFGSADRAERTERLAALTARELEIAELVAQGLTSQAIADRLFVSRRTVETHVSRTFRKTGVSSRTALAALMARRRAGGRFGDAGPVT
ncbi:MULTISPECIES: helix-turn-helix transcriptional regulator [Streptomyces]|uniref:Putative LuxR-family regulator n=9 Tax=Streptomyces scabiei TaxID=1930 RepID=C9Z1Z7_STRSW|nr:MULTISPECIES: LuxR family transcriptional regulator [Streptomyces]MBP5927156.1 AAA family ATPase [Streptomyces sp. LBUM 1479]KFG06346.1 LuxR family transcriptional regulator [Streptomyces scabiei]MBP5889608.1 AAA family ATPase [Streptomyces sp. LBUM 1481]MBP5919632.1 AAA family ATPase [Streptomyces sp. LBUM 1483]MDX2578698.1 AAA family ATPase [Streptomyces scabiei]